MGAEEGAGEISDDEVGRRLYKVDGRERSKNSGGVTRRSKRYEGERLWITLNVNRRIFN